MRLVHVPLAKFGGFVLVKTKVHTKWNLCFLERSGKAEVRRRIVGRVAAENEKHVYFSSIHVRDQLVQ